MEKKYRMSIASIELNFTGNKQKHQDASLPEGTNAELLPVG